MENAGLISHRSGFPVKATLDRIESLLSSMGITIFARIDHADGAKKAGLELRPTEVLVFGSPKAGTPLMQDIQTVGLDLPLKVLAWEDANGLVWLTYNDVDWFRSRYGLGETSARPLSTMTSLFSALSAAVAEDVKSA